MNGTPDYGFAQIVNGRWGFSRDEAFLGWFTKESEETVQPVVGDGGPFVVTTFVRDDGEHMIVSFEEGQEGRCEILASRLLNEIWDFEDASERN